MKTNEIVYTGELIGYTSRLNFFSNSTNAIVKIEGKARKIPIDNRQRELIQREYPPGSMVDVGFNGTWYIKSHFVSDDFKPQVDVAPFFDQ
jgi:hypothetical protein